MAKQPLYYNNDIFYPVPIIEEETEASLWDKRDLEFGLRDQLAHLVARIVAGVDDVTPADIDYAIADKIRRLIETEAQIDISSVVMPEEVAAEINESLKNYVYVD